MIQSFEFADVDLRKSSSDLSKCETIIREKHEFVDVCFLFSELIGSMCEPLIYGLLGFYCELTRHRGFSECSPVTWFPKIIIRL